jgi:hypothetical protein
MKEPKPCLREGCPNTRHDPNNTYCRDCRASYQCALRIVRKKYVSDRDDNTKRAGRPFRKVDDDVLYFINKINLKQPKQ